MSSINGGPNAIRNIAGLEKKIRTKILKQAIRAGAKVMAKEVKANAPEDTGRLKRSIKLRAGKRKKGVISINVVVSGGHDTPFVTSVEYGNEHTVAHPFIRPAFNSTVEPVGELIVRQVKDAIEAFSTD
jgi:HK97 gp10 family phage protein